VSGHIWGYAKDVNYMPIDVTYSYLTNPGAKWNFRYAPELTALAMLDEPQPGSTDVFTKRTRTYGSGISPVGFRANFYPESRVQPFLSTDDGFVYFMDRVLSPQGSQFMYTIDIGGGVQFFRRNRHRWLSLSAPFERQHQPLQSGHGHERVLLCGLALQEQGISVKQAPGTTKAALSAAFVV